jgi:hypothetical protein
VPRLIVPDFGRVHLKLRFTVDVRKTLLVEASIQLVDYAVSNFHVVACRLSRDGTLNSIQEECSDVGVEYGMIHGMIHDAR